MSAPVKLSSPATREFWEIPVLHEDDHLLALDKPARLLTSPDRLDLQRPSLLQLLHAGITLGKPWAKDRGLTYLMNAHRLDFETSGVLLLAKTKPVLIALANLFGSEQPVHTWAVLIHGAPRDTTFTVGQPIAPHPVRPGEWRVDARNGKRARTRFTVRERFANLTLLDAQPVTLRPHQVRAHLQHAGYPVVGDALYGGHPLLLSQLKDRYRLKPGRKENPLLQCAALHAEKLTLVHPITGGEITMTAPWPHDLSVAVKFLRRYAVTGG